MTCVISEKFRVVRKLRIRQIESRHVSCACKWSFLGLEIKDINTESVSDFLMSSLLISCQLTSRAKLGSKAYGFLKKGKATPDQLLVDIMVESVR